MITMMKQSSKMTPYGTGGKATDNPQKAIYNPTTQVAGYVRYDLTIIGFYEEKTC